MRVNGDDDGDIHDDDDDSDEMQFPCTLTALAPRWQDPEWLGLPFSKLSKIEGSNA